MMALRCKPGDLAVVVYAPITPEMIGKFVLVERLAVDGEKCLDGPGVYVLGGDASWIIVSATNGGLLPTRTVGGRILYLKVRSMADICLRPIRPNEGEDETLSYSRPRVEELA